MLIEAYKMNFFGGLSKLESGKRERSMYPPLKMYKIRIIYITLVILDVVHVGNEQCYLF